MLAFVSAAVADLCLSVSVHEAVVTTKAPPHVFSSIMSAVALLGRHVV